MCLVCTHDGHEYPICIGMGTSPFLKYTCFREAEESRGIRKLELECGKPWPRGGWLTISSNHYYIFLFSFSLFPVVGSYSSAHFSGLGLLFFFAILWFFREFSPLVRSWVPYDCLISTQWIQFLSVWLEWWELVFFFFCFLECLTLAF